MTQAYSEIDSPVGRLLLSGEPGCLRVLSLGGQPKETWREDPTPFQEGDRTIEGVFRGRTPSNSPWHSTPRERRFRLVYGESWSASLMAKPFLMANSPSESGIRRHRAPSVWRTDKSDTLSSCRAIV